MVAITAPSPRPVLSVDLHPLTPAHQPRRGAPRCRPAAPTARPTTAHREAPEVYRRRRFVAAAIVAGVVLAGLWSMGLFGRIPLTATEQAPRLELIDRSTYVVQPGDTLWSIARRAQPTGDVRPLVDRLAAQHGAALQVGDRVTLP